MTKGKRLGHKISKYKYSDSLLTKSKPIQAIILQRFFAITAEYGERASLALHYKFAVHTCELLRT